VYIFEERLPLHCDREENQECKTGISLNSCKTNSPGNPNPLDGSCRCRSRSYDCFPYLIPQPIPQVKQKMVSTLRSKAQHDLLSSNIDR